MQLIWHGTASIELRSSSGHILFDPFVPLKGSSVPVKLEDFDGFDNIFVTHGHLDHIVSIPAIVRRNPSLVVYCTKTPRETLLRKKVPSANLRLVEYGQIIDLNGMRVSVFHGKHAVLPKLTLGLFASMISSPYRGNIPYIIRENRICKENDETAVFKVEADGKTVLLLGSMNLRDDRVYPTGSDVLVLPYNGWDDNFTPAVRIIERLKPKKVLLDHYDDTFPPVTRPVDLAPLLYKYEGLVTAMEHGKIEELNV
jgi:L-ascorbate metabolism protein UlaG (beta-lactamase superfamily)